MKKIFSVTSSDILWKVKTHLDKGVTTQPWKVTGSLGQVTELALLGRLWVWEHTVGVATGDGQWK